MFAVFFIYCLGWCVCGGSRKRGTFCKCQSASAALSWGQLLGQSGFNATANIPYILSDRCIWISVGSVFFVFNVQYPHELRNCYSFFEKVLGIASEATATWRFTNFVLYCTVKPTTGKSAILNELYSNSLRVWLVCCRFVKATKSNDWKCWLIFNA